MKKGSTLFLKTVIWVMGLAVLGLVTIAIPMTIGDVDVWGYDPVLVGIMATSIPFFIALYQGLKLLGLIDANKAFSLDSINALKTIKRSALTISGMYLVGMPFIFRVAEADDAPGVVLIGMLCAAAPFVVAVFAAVLQKLLQTGMEIKSENELTV